MTARFQSALTIVLGHEGGLSDDKSDRGGLTNFGVTQKTYADFCKLTGREVRPVSKISMDEVEVIYGSYWKAGHCDYLVEPLDMLVFDCAINSGATRAIKLLQRALGVNDDGICGKGTLAAMHEDIAAIGIDSLCDLYLDEREAFYERIVEKDSTQQRFLAGWLNRLDHLRELV